MIEILDSEVANVCYDRQSDSIIAVWKQEGETGEMEKITRKVELAFSRYNARFFISDCTCSSVITLDVFFRFVHNMIKKGVQKIALIADEEPPEAVKRDLSLLGACKLQCFHSLISAKEWTNSIERKQ